MRTANGGEEDEARREQLIKDGAAREGGSVRGHFRLPTTARASQPPSPKIASEETERAKPWKNKT
jgi:hypothetical protein